MAQLQSEPYNKKLLGSLYPVLENELNTLISAKGKAKTGDKKVDDISNEMIGSEDPLSVLSKYKGQLDAEQIKTLTAIAKSLKAEDGINWLGN